MRKHLAYLILVVFAVASAFSIALTNATANVSKGVSVGETISDFKAADLEGNELSLASVKGKNGTVLIFISVQCPVSNAYNQRMEELAEVYRAKGVNVVGIYPNATESVDAIKRHSSENKFTFKILKDNGNKVADQLGANHTPEVYLLDASGKLVYQGRIDNQKNAAMVTSTDLRDAIDATLAGKPVAKSKAAAFGCSIKRVA
jgi:peroxiredoxin